MDASDRTWPGIPAGQKYSPTKISGEFKQIIANRRFTNEEIGRIVRCIVMETDFFVTPRIEAEVYHFRQIMERKKKASERMQEWRRVNRGGKARVCSEAESDVDCNDGGEAILLDTNFSCQKTPTNLVEKTPPIIPLKKSVPSSLEKSEDRSNPQQESKPEPKRESWKPKHRSSPERDEMASAIQQNLFSFIGGNLKPGEVHLPSRMASEGTQEREEPMDVEVDVQDIEIDSSGLLDAPDTRSGLAWIPERFAVFWSQYPRHTAKGRAEKAFEKAIKRKKDVDGFMKTLLSSLEVWKKNPSWNKDNGKYIPYASTWLNNEYWKDTAKDHQVNVGNAQYLNNSESDEELLRRMREG